jgi:hypothetical protein
VRFFKAASLISFYGFGFRISRIAQMAMLFKALINRDRLIPIDLGGFRP